MLANLGDLGEEDHSDEDLLTENQDLLDYERWKGHLHSFCKRGRFNISEISDIYDSSKFD